MSDTSGAARRPLMERFIAEAGWTGAELQPLAGDASTRRYVRLVRGGRSAMLMDQPRGAETAACPRDASPDERRKLGYNAMARLAGPDCRPFAAVSHYLRGRGLSAPDILAHDYGNGFLLIEDLGDGRFADLMAGGQSERVFYETAIDALVDLHAAPAPKTLQVPGAENVHLLAYDPVAMEAEVLLLPDWFIPAASGAPLADDARAVALGGITWIVARYVLSISGADRELTEGITALLAAAMLLYVGWWLHSRANAQAWNQFIRQQINATPELWPRTDAGSRSSPIAAVVLTSDRRDITALAAHTVAPVAVALV